MPANAYEWWHAGPAIGIVLVILLVVAIWAYAAYRKMRNHRDQAHREMSEARRELSEAQRTLDEARRDWQGAIRALTPRLKEQTEKLSEVIEGLNRWQEDRKKLGLGTGWEMRAEAVIKGSQADRQRLREQITGYRKMADKGMGALKRLVERPRTRAASGQGKELTPETE